ncbi:unnamed protein product [Toxocara canis]|uniref:G_PROTEIN_RECEP_F1_2 domain-containing protein n=1 Tax=Toxocara canis TaxID=6265 RepID=A0A183VFS6_TOXCA|nr:unnamed protein product [Toxocara canis]
MIVAIVAFIPFVRCRISHRIELMYHNDIYSKQPIKLVANFAALLVNIATLSMYFIYPPLTWRVPIFGVGPQEKKKE